MGGGSGALDREGRLASVDQCRGFALLAMLFGNFMGKYSFMPWALTHHPHGFSLNETIAPLFFFLVGMSYRGAFRGAWRWTAPAGPGVTRCAVIS